MQKQSNKFRRARTLFELTGAALLLVYFGVNLFQGWENSKPDSDLVILPEPIIQPDLRRHIPCTECVEHEKMSKAINDKILKEAKKFRLNNRELGNKISCLIDVGNCIR